MQENLIPLDNIKRLLSDRRLYVVAEKSGLSYPTVKRIADGDMEVSLRTWRKLSAYFAEPDHATE